MHRSKGEATGDTTSEAPIYVNHCTIAADLSGAQLTFSQAGSGQGPLKVKARLVTTPTHLKRFRDAIFDACRLHDRQFVDAQGEER